MTPATQQGRCSHGSWVYTGGLPREDVALSLASLQEAPAGQAGALREKTSLTHLPGCLLAEDRLEEWSIPIKIELLQLRHSRPHGDSICDLNQPQDMWRNRVLRKPWNGLSFLPGPFKGIAQVHTCFPTVSQSLSKDWPQTRAVF